MCLPVSLSMEEISRILIGGKGDSLAGSLTLTESKPAIMFPCKPIRSLGDIIAGALTLTASEPGMSPGQRFFYRCLSGFFCSPLHDEN